MKVTRTAMQGGGNSLVMLTANSEDSKRTANITITKTGEATKFNVTYQSKE